MLTLTSDIPVKQECVDKMQDIFGQMRDLITECEQVLHLTVESQDILMTREEVAEYLKVAPNKIPPSIPRFRLDHSARFKRSDVMEFVNSRLRK